MVGLLAVSAFFIGSLYQRVKTLENRTVAADKNAQEVAGAGTQDAPLPQEPETADNVPPVSADDHVRGDREARIALIEYSDFECPFCKNFHSTAKQAVDEYDGEVVWVYRHFPLDFHANAQIESEASECTAELAGEGGFWEYADTIYERSKSNGVSFTKEGLVDIAVEQGINQGEFTACLDSGRYTQAIKDEMAAGAAAGVSGTPGNILLDTQTGNTRLIPGAVPFEQLKQGIDELLSET